MAIKPNRKCIICGERYVYCPTCRDSRPDEPWRNIYDSEDCMAVANIWYAYRGKEISKEDAKKKIEQYPAVLEKVFKLSTVAAIEIKAICDYVEEVIEPEGEVTPTEENVVIAEEEIAIPEEKPEDPIEDKSQSQKRTSKRNK